MNPTFEFYNQLIHDLNKLAFKVIIIFAFVKFHVIYELLV